MYCFDTDGPALHHIEGMFEIMIYHLFYKKNASWTRLGEYLTILTNLWDKLWTNICFHTVTLYLGLNDDRMNVREFEDIQALCEPPI